MKQADLEDILNKGLSGNISLSDITTLLSTDRTLSSDEQSVLHMLVHFVTDQDLRSKDLMYDQLLRKQINEAFDKTRVRRNW